MQSYRSCKTQPTDPKLLHDSFTVLTSLFTFYRLTRNEVGHPEIVPNLAKGVILANMAQFIHYLDTVYGLIDFFRSEQEAVAFHGDFPNFNVEVAAELVPADLDRAHDEVWGRSGFALVALLFAPLPFEGEATEHGCLAGAGGGAPDGAGGFGGVPQIGEHVDAALFDGRGLRVLILVDHVLVGGLLHELPDLGFDPGGAEGGEILLGVAIEDELIVDGLVDRLRVLLCVGEFVAIGLLVQDLGLELAGWTSL